MNELIKSQILFHATQDQPKEACGLILNVSGKEIYFPCRNIAENQKDFIMDPADFMRAEDMGEVLAVVHSHVNVSARPSQADLVGCEASGLPWHIVSIPSQQWEMITPTGYRAPLVGRQFVHGILDCYSLIRDWYRQERAVELPEFERREEWWTKGGNLYLENFTAAGFEPAKGELEVGDVILMQIGSPVVNHAAIYLGRDVILHHLLNRLSTREVYGGFWKKNTRLIIRHRGNP